ncbi:FitA-like ribbon-helix-helix domain-containing protein [Saccharomonospora saliphila]|uniref:FitA-like ribbon-helix-helix domain-containing protein n=1 Tax=Saccharomonospora saliphila TaxID=369829 RepID=UPI0003A8E024|nr:plasmid stabilization protein [Saccharomonospora saliphila]
MATLTIREFDDGLKARLRVRAAEHGRSMEAEVREILRTALVSEPEEAGLGSRVRRRFTEAGEYGVEAPERHERPRAAEMPE